MTLLISAKVFLHVLFSNFVYEQNSLYIISGDECTNLPPDYIH